MKFGHKRAKWLAGRTAARFSQKNKLNDEAQQRLAINLQEAAMAFQRHPVLAKASDWITNICAQFFIYWMCYYCYSYPLEIRGWARAAPIHAHVPLRSSMRTGWRGILRSSWIMA